ncbi:MAG: transcriptional regulator, TraR/DksA family [Frankiales bacterium]|nr:transcriptional regulator, TraR/DksA family [Frankiales bacterium]
MPYVTDPRRDRLEAALADNGGQLADLREQYDDFVAASQESNADDEHDPEGATIAFERQQVVALIDAATRSRADILRGLAALAAGDYGACEACGGPIGEERLEARPNARTCITCATNVPRGNPRGSCG